MLFMQPWDAAQASNAPRMTSTTRCDVNTLPPTTAACSEGQSKLPCGMMTCTGLRQPWKTSQGYDSSWLPFKLQLMKMNVTAWNPSRWIIMSLMNQHNWPLAIPWLTDELSQSVPAYKQASLKRLAGCPITTEVYTKHTAMLFLKTMVKRFKAVQIEPWV